ncbi:hypothetical protein AcW1_000365 [Taiwanofungus camphoratus]|nr:hypothetical protein AcW1_000365 [Antrodia cinnamomea]
MTDSPFTDSPFVPLYNPAGVLPHHKGDEAAYGLDDIEYHKQSFDFLLYGGGATGVLAPHPDQFESELDSLAAFDAELNLLPQVETGTGDIFSFLRSDTPTCGSTFTVSSESVSGYDSGYADSISGHSESVFNFSAQSPIQNPSYAASNYSFTGELDMDFQRLGIPTNDDHSAYGGIPSSPSMGSSPGNVPNIAHYSPQTSFSSPRGSFSDYEPAQPQQVHIGSSAASDYYPQMQAAQIKQHHNYTGTGAGAQSTVSPSNVSPLLPAVPPIPLVNPHKGKMEGMQDDPKRKYQCPQCPRAFARAYNLKTHIQTHDPNRSKPYACHHKTCGSVVGHVDLGEIYRCR